MSRQPVRSHASCEWVGPFALPLQLIQEVVSSSSSGEVITAALLNIFDDRTKDLWIEPIVLARLILRKTGHANGVRDASIEFAPTARNELSISRQFGAQQATIIRV